jgi:two-component system CheB/CheR fusion protein
MNLDIGLPVQELKRDIRACLTADDYRETVVNAINRRGKSIKCPVTCSRFAEKMKESVGVILLMEEID